MSKHSKLSLIVIIAFCSMAYAASRGDVFVQKTSRNDGDTMTPVYVSCSSTTWTTLLSAGPKRRVAKLTTLASTDVVCVVTSTASASLCDATLPSWRINPTIVFEHASEASLKCRAADTKAAVAVYGVEYDDSADNASYP